jgi:hypothetical protein
MCSNLKCNLYFIKFGGHLRHAFLKLLYNYSILFFFGATAPILASAYLHETLRFTSVSDLRQSTGLLGRVISLSQGFCLYTNTEKRARAPNTKRPRPEWDSNPRSRPPSERKQCTDRLPCPVLLYLTYSKFMSS